MKAVPIVIAIAVVAFAIWRRGVRPGLIGRRTQRPAAIRGISMPSFLRSGIWLIAAREMRQRMRGKLFRGVTVLMLAGVAAAIIIPVAVKGGPSSQRVGVVGELSPAAQAVVSSSGTAVGTTVHVVIEPDADAASADLNAGRINVAVVGGQEVLTKKAITSRDTSTTSRLARAMAAALGEQQAVHDAGLTAGQAAQLAAAQPLALRSLEPAHGKSTIRTASVIGIILLFVMLTQYNTWTMVGVMEEKSSRVVEVLLATVRPIQLLAGKVLGIGVLVFAQAGLVVGFALALAAAVGSDLLHGAGPATVVSILVWLVLGYAFYSWVYAAAGSMAERQDEVQSLAIPIAIPMIAGYILALTVAGSGSPSTFFYVLAYLPPTAPFAMPVLIGLGDVTWWQVTVSALISIASTIGVARLAAYVYRRAVLRTGRRVRFREILARQPAA